MRVFLVLVVSLVTALGICAGVRLGSTSCVASNGVDLSGLVGPSAYSWYDGTKYTYVFNLCNPLVNVCNWQAGSAICQEFGIASEINYGMTSTQSITYNSTDDSYSFFYSGGDPDGNQYRTTTIKVVCNPAVESILQVQGVTQTTPTSILMVANSALVCIKPPEQKCTTSGFGAKYDISALSYPLNFSMPLGDGYNTFALVPCGSVPGFGSDTAALMSNSLGTIALGAASTISLAPIPIDKHTQTGYMGVVATYSGGYQNSTVTAYLLCNEVGETAILSVTPVTPRDYIITATTQAACPQN